ncbi:hypothetical protein [Aquimarina sp. 2201CG14-23]|uniref:hypothetical protein n=1 Tax=Aquimarina mycalae TaxID=3040073 RepID=UPI00247813BE|nr:hypothetical protein [Aquimarina sp. 2201CG14-23]MDH7447236.1 hypothetical protein [Aquimarina sp. 2201CG14-23]
MKFINLFSSRTAITIFPEYVHQIKTEIDRHTDEYILGVNYLKLKEYYIDKYSFEPLSIKFDKLQVTLENKEGKNFEIRTGVRNKMDVYSFTYSIPFEGYYKLLSYKPSNFALSVNNNDNLYKVDSESLKKGIIKGKFKIAGKSKAKFELAKKGIIKFIEENYQKINKDLSEYLGGLESKFENIFNQRLMSAQNEKSFIESLDLQEDSSIDKVIYAPVVSILPEQDQVLNSKENSYSKIPQLKNKTYNKILNTINLIYKSVEKKKKIYRGLDEEGLRDYILPFLEFKFDNATVTGETFNKEGRTDILVKHIDGTNLFIAECKKWKGAIALKDAVNQLFDRYLTWRDSKVAIILFVENKDFSTVIETIKTTIPKHDYYIRYVGANDETSFSYLLHFPEDKGKLVYTEIMAFHFPK